MASYRPIVSNSVGEIPRFFVDEENAYICAPGDSELFGKNIIKILEDPAKANQVGIMGRNTAKNCFHYTDQINEITPLMDRIISTKNNTR